MPSIACSIPTRTGGTLTLYKTLRRTMSAYGWDVYALSLCRAGHESDWQEAAADDGCVRIDYDSSNPRSGARRFVEWCEHRGLDIVIIVDDRVATSAIPHFSSKIRVVAQACTIAAVNYRLDTRFLGETDTVIATSPRQYADLYEIYHVPAEKLTMVPHGVDIPSWETDSIPHGGTELRLGYVGRLDHVFKGVFYLPKILRQLDCCATRFHLDIVGTGPAENRLRQALGEYVQQGSVRFHGHVPNERIYGHIKAMQVLIIPSIFEGFGLSLIEAMAAGVVPVVSRIRGVTDWIVTHGKTGILCGVGDTRAFAQAIASLDRNRKALAAMAIAARLDAVERFSADRMAADYRRLFGRLMRHPSARRARSWDEYRYEALPYAWLRRLVPRSLKSLIRRWQTA